MSNNNTFNQRNNERFQEQARNRRFNQRGGKEEQKNIMKITKKDCRNKHEINIHNYLVNRKI